MLDGLGNLIFCLFGLIVIGMGCMYVLYCTVHISSIHLSNINDGSLVL